MKKHSILSLFAGLTMALLNIGLGGCQKMDRPQMAEIIPDPADDGSIRILTVGNSFSEDAVEHHLSGLAQAAGIPLTIGNLYIAGASLLQHENNIRQNAGAYSYRKINRTGEKTITAGYSIARALADENWTHISFQQVSQLSGQYPTWETSLPLIYEYTAPRAKNTSAKFLLHQTWAYAKTSTHDGFVQYNRDQDVMYKAIVEAVEKAKSLVHIDQVVPAGTAIQNLRTSIIGDNVTSDGYHLDPNIGRYTAACTWFEALTGQSVIGNSYMPAGMSKYEAEIAQQAAHTALATPLQVTDMVNYKDWGGSFDFTRPIYLDFGQSVAASGWNGVTGFMAGFAISNLKDRNGDFTGISFSIDSRFNGVNNNGVLNTSTGFNMPESVARNSLFGNAGTAFNGMVVEKSILRLFGLDPAKSYDICYYGSRDAVNDNRETAFTSTGANEATVYSNTSRNRSEVVCTNGIRPNAKGEILVTVGAGPNNNNANKFYYISAMRIQPAT
ncbi:DUF4886 domain-containing protein [Sphingobacterium sp. lm-10]|uniref:DUF4886 domain-containing protein n=1 Tax=Sphingobacterium sp. lm-10 TaxID=2944904 RepID=UPI0020207CD0|nr:DUF4886 domain-containing protein [Sphingobacterium sp. lm-10]MCL7987825.1 DUF4886 domain-containing protein [Sphingobacterium sp. lm-10]